jgi:hypothetical protein
MPFLAHAVGTLAGALAAVLIAASYKVQIAYVIGALFFCGGPAGRLPADGVVGNSSWHSF